LNPVEFSVETCTEGERCTLVLAGELDMGTAARLEAAVAGALERAPRELVLDMRQVSFTDSTGLRAILRARRSAEGLGGEFFLIRSEEGEQHHLFQVSGLIGELTFREPDPGGPGPAGRAFPSPAPHA
jgi:anti-sigma B factor antagonist